jgi:hypothetical protein
MRIGIDVKAESRPADLPLIEGLWAKADHLELDRYCVVSLSGFTADARKVYAAKGVKLVTLDEVQDLHWAGLTHISMVHRLFDFKHTRLDYHPGEVVPSQEAMARAADWMAGFDGGEASPWTQYLAAQVGRAVPMEPGGPAEGESGPYRVAVTFDDGTRASLKITAGTLAVPVPAVAIADGHFRWETKRYPVVKYRTEKGEEVISALVEMPGWSGGVFQMSFGMVAVPGEGQALSVRLAPATPKRTPV